MELDGAAGALRWTRVQGRPLVVVERRLVQCSGPLAAEPSGQNCRGLRYVSEFPSAWLLEVLECRSAPAGKVSGPLLNSTQADSHLLSCGSSHRLGRVLDALRTCGGVNSAAVPCWRG